MQQMAGDLAATYLGQVDAGIADYTGSWLQRLRFYFDVNNKYVLDKLRLLLFPFKHQEWERQPNSSGRMRPPREEVVAPDLYIPTMAFATYVMVMGFALGAQGRFTPDVLGLAASSGLVILLLEVFAIKLTWYLTTGAAFPFLELCSCSGYKFVGVAITCGAQASLGPVGGWLMLAMTCASIGTFMVKTLRQMVSQAQGFAPGFLTEGIASPAATEARKKQNYALWSVAAIQVVWTWYLCHGV